MKAYDIAYSSAQSPYVLAYSSHVEGTQYFEGEKNRTSLPSGGMRKADRSAGSTGTLEKWRMRNSKND